MLGRCFKHSKLAALLLGAGSNHRVLRTSPPLDSTLFRLLRCLYLHTLGSSRHGVSTSQGLLTLGSPRFGVSSPWGLLTLVSPHPGVSSSWGLHELWSPRRRVSIPQGFLTLGSPHPGVSTPWGLLTLGSPRPGVFSPWGLHTLVLCPILKLNGQFIKLIFFPTNDPLLLPLWLSS